MGSKLVAPHMIKAGWGRIVTIASTQAIATEAACGAYAASKGAIVSFTKSLAVELAPFGINANAIAPGCIHTPMSVINGADETTTEYFKTWYVGKRKIPLARPGQPEEIARVAVFLASDDDLLRNRSHAGGRRRPDHHLLALWVFPQFIPSDRFVN
jgi:3-oxoacyl-[acyl-carrier protein] reductase